MKNCLLNTVFFAPFLLRLKSQDFIIFLVKTGEKRLEASYG